MTQGVRCWITRRAVELLLGKLAFWRKVITRASVRVHATEKYEQDMRPARIPLDCAGHRRKLHQFTSPYLESCAREPGPGYWDLRAAQRENPFRLSESADRSAAPSLSFPRQLVAGDQLPGPDRNVRICFEVVRFRT